jgi:MoaA/NifB/PqqE/SkfB family radical SAM enzyme
LLNICYESTKNCNLSCEYCITADNPIPAAENEKYLDILKRISILQPDRLVISGGEPLLDNMLIEKLKFIRQEMQSTYISLSTNATKKFDFKLLRGLG